MMLLKERFMNIHTQLLSETLRPQTLAEITLPDDDIRFLEAMTASKTTMNLLFYGKPGAGKTSTAKIILKEIDADVRIFNGSFNEGDKAFIKMIKGYAYTTSMLERPKVCFIDEADFMPVPVQEALRFIIEETSENCRYLMTANNIDKMTDAIKSRCQPLSFDISVKDRVNIIDRMTKQYDHKLQQVGIKLDEKKINEIISLYFPDYRKIANRFQMETFRTA
jgi:DNA polymerase III delta prime subunit